ncbi:MAG: RluA family pseudouridine synthase [Thermodesulfobacteriota bacterium]
MDFEFEVAAWENGFRLDRLVSEKYPGLSRSAAARSIKSGDIRVGEKRVKPAYQVSSQEIVKGVIDEAEPFDAAAERIALEVLFEDPYIVVVNKPRGLVVHPGPGNHSGTLVNALLHHCPEIGGAGPDMTRSGIVHRLDKDTSGVIVAAKTPAALSFLQKEFKHRRVKKTYTAIVSGAVTGEKGAIRLPLRRHPTKRKMMAVDREKGKYAETEWKVLERFDRATLVKVTLKTGRTHQIRAHFYAEGHPLIGEKVYQTRKRRRTGAAAQRQMLHSSFISFRHPFSGQRVCFKAPLSEDFQQVLEGFRSK